MYFLIGLGIIVIIVYGNMLYDRIKTKKNKDMTLGHKPFLFLEPEYISPFEPGAEGVSFLRSLWD